MKRGCISQHTAPRVLATAGLACLAAALQQCRGLGGDETLCIQIFLCYYYRWLKYTIYRGVSAQSFWDDLLPVGTFLYRWKDLYEPYNMVSAVY